MEWHPQSRDLRVYFSWSVPAFVAAFCDRLWPRDQTNQLDKPTVFTPNLCLCVLVIHWSCFLCGESILLGLWKQFIRVFFYNFHLIIRIQQNENYKKKSRDLTKDWTWIPCLTVRHSNHYTSMFSVVVWGCNWILSMYGWFCLIRLILLIRRKSLRFKKNN